jgi:hypothetical protein
MQATLEQIRNLERLYSEGYEDSFLDRSLRKIVAHQLARDQSDLAGLEKDLAELEARYDMDSEEFYVRYREGQLGDDADFVEWSALYQMVTRLRARLSILRGQEA